MTRLLIAIGAAGLVIGGCSSGSFIDEITIVNDTAYSASIDVTDGEREGWLSVTTIAPQSTRVVEEVTDQGDVWIFRFDHIGKHQQEVEISRPELEGNQSTVEVPPSFEQRLRELGIPPPP